MILGSSALSGKAAKDRTDLLRVLALRVAYSLLTLFPGRVGGSETYVRGLLRALAARNGRPSA